MKQTYDAIIIGGGIMGLICAYQLSDSGKKVVVFEKDDSCSGSSKGSLGVISWYTKKPGYHRQLFMNSWRLLHDLADDLGDVGLNWKSGSLVLAETELEMQDIQKTYHNAEIPKGFSMELLDREQTLKLEPYVTPEILGSLFVPDVVFVDLLDYTFALRRAAIRKGAEIYNETPVIRLIQKGSRIIGVQTAKDLIYAEDIINCAGINGSEVAEMAGVKLDIVPRRGHTVVCQQTKPMVFHNLYCTLYNVMKFHPELIQDEEIRKRGVDFTLHQARDGSIYMSGNREYAGFDTRADNDTFRMIVQGALKRMPALKDVLILRAFAGLRPSTGDGLPMIGRISGLDGFFMCAGHEGDGVALSPVTARITRDLINDGHTDLIDTEPLSPMRFLN